MLPPRTLTFVHLTHSEPPTAPVALDFDYDRGSDFSIANSIQVPTQSLPTLYNNQRVTRAQDLLPMTVAELK